MGINEFQSREKYTGRVKLLDVGCGVGRHLKIGHRFGFEVHGIELSQVAVNHALAFLESEIGVDLKAHIVCGDATKMPWDPEFFDAVVSDSVLDSMDYSIAEEVVGEVPRSLKSGGLFYLSLISFRDDAGILRKGQMVVEGDHEAGTIQSYFDEKKK